MINTLLHPALCQTSEPYLTDRQIAQNTLSSMHRFLSVYFFKRFNNISVLATQPLTQPSGLLALKLIAENPLIFPLVIGQKLLIERKLVRIRQESTEAIFFSAELRICKTAHEALMRYVATL